MQCVNALMKIKYSLLIIYSVKNHLKKKKSLKMESSVVSTRATHGTTFPRIPCCGYYASLPGYVSTVKRNWDAEMCFL